MDYSYFVVVVIAAAAAKLYVSLLQRKELLYLLYCGLCDFMVLWFSDRNQIWISTEFFELLYASDAWVHWIIFIPVV